MLQQVAAYLSQRQWEFEQLDQDTILSGFTSPLPDSTDHGFPLYVMRVQDEFGDEYVRLVIVPYVQQPEDSYSQDLYRRIAVLNHDMPMLRFAVDADGDLELLVDLSVAQFDEVNFNTSVQVLADYAGLRYRDLAQLVADNP